MDISLNSVDDATLEYMVNVAQYEKYLRKNHIDYDTGFKRDLKFYRKRIISITKDLFKNELKDVHLNGAFNMYMKACISHLKFEDQSETIQKCYVCMGVMTGEAAAQQEQQQQHCICNNVVTDFEINKANELCFKPKEIIITKKRAHCFPTTNCIQSQRPIIQTQGIKKTKEKTKNIQH
jgi:hypothetical protein